MYLKSLELQGFKSFPDKTVLNFERGVTVVVGPNGSGKSNISDAMRWVLGEISSKNIRGSKMEDVIFGGSDQRAPMGYAEVSVTFDNTPDLGKIDYPADDITVTRRYYRAGESEYYINRKPVRLKDIHEMFLSTGVGREGYSNVGQGRISEILSRKSEDRRGIFEEAAGISKYRYKKQESERSLASAEANIVRINDIFLELSARVGPLEKEAEKARKYLGYFEEKKKADISLWLFDNKTTRTAASQAEEAFRLAETELKLSTEALDALEAESDRVFANQQANKQHSERLWSAMKEKSDAIRKLEGQYQVIENEIAHAKVRISDAESQDAQKKEQIAAIEEEKGQLAAKKTELEERARSILEEIASLETKKAELTGRIEEARDALAADLRTIQETEAEKTDLRVRLSALENASASGSEQNADFLSDLEKYRDTMGQLQAQLEEFDRTINGYAEQIADYDAVIAALSAELENEMSELLADKEQLANENAELVSVQQRIENLRRLEEHFDGYSYAVKYVMSDVDQNRIRGQVYGPVSQLIHTDDRNVVALETALGSALQNIVVEDEATAKSAIYALKNAGAGRATFLPVSSMRPSDRTAEQNKASGYPGFVGFADDLVETDPKFRTIIRSLLGRIAVFDTLDHATDMAKGLRYAIRAVTLDGQQINANGSFTGGSQKRESGMLTRSKQIKDLETRRDELTASAKALEERITSGETGCEKKKRDLSGKQEYRSVLDTMMRAEQGHREGVAAKLETNEELVSGMELDLEKLAGQSETLAREADSIRDSIASLEESLRDLHARRSDCDIRKSELEDESEECDHKIAELRLGEVQAKTEAEGCNSMIASLDDRILQLNAEIGQLADLRTLLLDTVEESRKSLEENKRCAAAASEEVGGLEAERKTVDEDAERLEKRLNEIRGLIKEKNAQKELQFRAFTKEESHLASLRNDLDKLTSRLWDEYELTLSSASELGYPEVTAETRKTVAASQTEYKNKIRALGSVNVSAIEEYEDVRTRYDTLKTQLDDLEATKKDLSSIIHDLETEMRGTFITAFDQINLNFSQVFKELFGGGSAEIILTEPEDVLTSGIEIRAAPPGKIIKNLSLLSGGEQAFVAIALYFAVLKYSPAPFCILDEIEAALDEVNVDRFAEYVQKYSLDTQFVLITHRRGTMEVADVLYGVTMPQKGISRVLTLNVSEIESFHKEMLS